MARRPGSPLYGNEYCGNTNTMEVHDLDNEDTRPSGCQIDEIIAARIPPRRIIEKRIIYEVII
jgi:hypothetical protein